MTEDMKQMEQGEVRVYQSLWRNLLTVVLCLAMAVLCGWIILRDDCPLWVRVVSGWMGVIFFGGGGLFMLISVIYNRVRHIPFLVIRRDSVDMWVSAKFRYCTINFRDVKQFRRHTRGCFPHLIAIDYRNTPLREKMDRSSGFMRKLMSFNILFSGAIESIPVYDLTMNGGEICDLLNSRLERKKN